MDVSDKVDGAFHQGGMICMFSSKRLVLKRLLVLGVLINTLACMRHVEAVTPRQLVEVADFSAPTISPDGRSVAFRVERAAIERNTFDTVWYVQDIEGKSPPRRVADGGFALKAFWGLSLPATVAWSPDGRAIYYRAMLDGKIDVWRAQADGSGAEPLTLDPADVRDFALSDDGRTLTYSVGATREQVARAERAEYDGGVRLSKAVPIGRPLFRSSYVEGRAETQRYLHGQELLSVPLLADVADQWKAIDLASGKQRETAASAAPSRPAFSTIQSNLAQGQTQAWEQAVDPENRRVAFLKRVGDDKGMYQKPYVELAVLLDGSREPMTCRAEPCTKKEITSVLWRPESDEVLFTEADSERGYAQSIFGWDIKTGIVRAIVRSHGLINGGRDEHSSCGASAQRLVCVAADADRPPRLERVDLSNGQRHVLFDPNAALAADMAANVSVRLLRWKDPKGRKFTGQLLTAHRTGDFVPPLFVNYYSCSGFLRGGTGDEWPLASLAQEGISALCITHSPLRLDAVERYDEGLSAVKSAIDSLASVVDRRKVGMGGLSFGSEVTMWTVFNSGLLAAASVSSPRTSPLAYELRSMYEDSFFPALRKFWQLGSPAETPQRWQRLSPVSNLKKVHTPLLMQLSEQEYMYALDYAVPLLKDQRAELYIFADETHQKFQPRHKLAVYQRNLDWFKFWLLNKEDPDPAKRDQYARWHLMKERLERK